MGITVTNLTVQGTACPWGFVGSAASGTIDALTVYGQGYNDGTNANSGGATNSAYRYGQQHTHAGETGPTTLSVTPYQTIILEYVSGTVATQAGGAGNSPAAGSATTTLTPSPGGESDHQGYTLPTNVIAGRTGFNSSGTLDTAGTAVTWASGSKFFGNMLDRKTIWINNAAFTIASIQDSTHLTLTATAGTQTGVNYFFYSATTSIGGLVGAFLDNSGNVIGTFDWAGQGGGAAGTYIDLIAPPAAATLSLGVNDTVLYDNTGSFSLTAFQMETDYLDGHGQGFWSDTTYLVQYPVGTFCVGAVRDYGASPTLNGVNIKTTVFLSTYFTPQMLAGAVLLKPYTGQVFPKGAQEWGGNPANIYGQRFPY